MNTLELELDDVTQFFCDVGQHGWSDLIVVNKGNVRVFRVSEVFTDFSCQVLKIVRAAIENTSVRVALCDEPCGVVISVEPDKKQLHTSILSIYEVDRPITGFDETEEGNLVLSVRTRRQRLVGMLLAELWKTHVSLRQRSYQKDRSGFPHKELIDLNNIWNTSDLGPSFLK